MDNCTKNIIGTRERGLCDIITRKVLNPTGKLTEVRL